MSDRTTMTRMRIPKFRSRFPPKFSSQPKPLSTYGLDKPQLEVVLRQGSTELVRIAIGAESKMPEGIYIKTADSPAVKVVSKDVFDKFNVKADDLIEAPPAEKPK